jgi:cysteine desulfuration protein SufE
MPMTTAARTSINDIQDRIVEEMAPMEDWFDKYEYLVGQGRKLAPLDERYRVEANLIQGCQSSVWVRAETTGGRIRFGADSDTLITKGMIALLLKVLDNQFPQDVARADLYFIQKTGLASNLSPSRANGLVSIVERMKQYARELGEP